MNDKITFYVLKTNKTNPDGTPYTGKYRNMYWLNGISLEVFSYNDAFARRGYIGGEIVPFKEFSREDIIKFAEKFQPKKIEKTDEYQKQLKQMAKYDFDFMSITDGKRDKDSINRAYQEFLNTV